MFSKQLCLLITLLFTSSLFAKVSTETELASIINGGNTQMETYNLKTNSNYKKEINNYSFGGHYLLWTTTSEDEDGDDVKTETARNWDVNTKWQRDLNEKTNSIFGIMYEGNEFNGIKQRDNYDFGFKQKTIVKEDTKSSVELTYRYSLERRTTRDDDDKDEFVFHKARLFADFWKKITPSTTSNTSLEYLPNFSQGDDYNVTFEQSLSVMIDKMFSLKVSYKSIYDNLPVEGSKMTDYIFSTALIATY